MKKLLLYILPVLLMFGCKKKGCTDELAFNYDDNPKVESAPGLCEYEEEGEPISLTKKIVDGDIQQGNNVVWSKIPGATVDYLVSTNVHIAGKLTIDPGVVIQFTSTGGLFVTRGQLIVDGTISENVVLENAAGTTNWLGVKVLSTANVIGRELKLHNVTIRNASSNSDCAVYVYKSCILDFNNLTLDAGANYGMIIGGMELTSTIDNVIIKGFKTPFLSNDWQVIDNLDEFTLMDNDNNWFEFYTSHITTSILNEFDNKYPVYFSNEGPIYFNGFYAKAGCEFLMAYNTTINVYGGLQCSGTASKPIVFRSRLSTNNWNGFKLSMDNDIDFDYTEIKGVLSNEVLRVAFNSLGFVKYTNGLIEANINTSCGFQFTGLSSVPSSNYDITGTTFTNVSNNICP